MMVNRRLKLLLVDDDQSFIKYARQIIGLMSDVKLAKVATDPKKGLKFMLEEHFDIVVLDVDMPELDGFQVMKQIQHLVSPSDPSVRPLFVILCSGYKALPQKCYQHHVAYFLEKPLSYDGLVEALTAIRQKMQVVPTVDDLNGGRSLMLAMEAGSERVSPTLFNKMACIIVDEAVCTVYFDDGRTEKYRKSLTAFMDFLPRNQFVQISRQVIIAFAHFHYRQEEVVYVHGCEEKLHLGGRDAYPAFYHWYDDNYEGKRLG